MSNTALLPWREMIGELLLDFDGCPSVVIEAKMRQAAIEFCHAAPVLVRELDPVFIVEGVTHYEIDSPVGLAIAHLLELTLEGNTLRGWSFELPNLLHFSSVPKPESLVRVRAAVKPVADAKGLPAWVGSQWLEPIRHGARAKLLLMPNKPWTNGELAAYHQRVFNEGIGNARAAELRGHRAQSLSVQMRRFV